MFNRVVLLGKSVRQSVRQSSTNASQSTDTTYSNVLGVIVSMGVGCAIIGYGQYDSYTTSKHYNGRQLEIKELTDYAIQQSDSGRHEKLRNIFKKHFDPSNYRYNVLSYLSEWCITPQMIVDLMAIGRLEFSEISARYYNQELFDTIGKMFKSLTHVPAHYQTEKLCLMCVSECNDSQYDENMCHINIRERLLGANVSQIRHPYTNVFMKAIERDPSTVILIRKEFQTKELWTTAVNKKPSLISSMPQEFQTEELWYDIISRYPHLISEYKGTSHKLWFLACSKNPSLIPNIKDPEIKRVMMNTSLSEMEQIIHKHDKIIIINNDINIKADNIRLIE